ncbi:MAG: DinB family protein, partial [Bacteroidota bacterium]
FFGSVVAEELNTIPEGFNNNLIWNLGHVLVTQQLLTYGLSYMPLKVSAELVNKYRKGTRPEGPINQGEIDYISSALMELPELFMEDYEGGQFKSFKQYSTS